MNERPWRPCAMRLAEGLKEIGVRENWAKWAECPGSVRGASPVDRPRKGGTLRVAEGTEKQEKGKRPKFRAEREMRERWDAWDAWDTLF